MKLDINSWVDCKQPLFAQKSVQVKNSSQMRGKPSRPLRIDLSRIPLQCVRTIAPERGWAGHFHTFTVFLSTPTSTQCHCLLECGTGLYEWKINLPLSGVFCVLWRPFWIFNTRARSVSARSGTEITEIARSMLGDLWCSENLRVTDF